jgi:kynurenine formamidase
MGVQEESLTYEALLERDSLKVSKSPWGPDDEVGRVNWVTPELTKEILQSLDGTHVFDLSVDFFMGMPSWTKFGDPPYQICMTHTPPGSVVDDSSGAGRNVHETWSYCGDAVSMYTHCGTHIDTLVHLGYFGTFWNGWNVAEHLGSRCWTVGGADKYPPLVSRGVLLDVAGLHGVDSLPDGYGVGRDDIVSCAREQGIELRRGDIVSIRTGRMRAWPGDEFLALPMPGLSFAGARYLCEETGAMIVGSDTAALEAFPSDEPGYAPVHCYMFATAGTPIIENLDLEELAAARQYEFAFLGFPLKFRGATGALMRPVAVPLRS